MKLRAGDKDRPTCLPVSEFSLNLLAFTAVHSTSLPPARQRNASSTNLVSASLADGTYSSTKLIGTVSIWKSLAFCPALGWCHHMTTASCPGRKLRLRAFPTPSISPNRACSFVTWYEGGFDKTFVICSLPIDMLLFINSFFSSLTSPVPSLFFETLPNTKEYPYLLVNCVHRPQYV